MIKNNIKYIFASKGVNSKEYFDSTNILKIVKDSYRGHQLIMFKSGK